MSESRVLLFGGTFDPIHNGHLTVVRQAAAAICAEQVVLIPARRPPHKAGRRITSARHRLKMCELAVEELPTFLVSDCELQREGPSYTIDTIRAFQQQLGVATDLYWLIGADMLADLSKWKALADLVRECTLVTAARPGYDREHLDPLRELLDQESMEKLQRFLIPTDLIDVGSTAIRERLCDGQDVGADLPEKVVDYIRQQNLYRR